MPTNATIGLPSMPEQGERLPSGTVPQALSSRVRSLFGLCSVKEVTSWSFLAQLYRFVTRENPS